jgi:hypothetical protein
MELCQCKNCHQEKMAVEGACKECSPLKFEEQARKDISSWLAKDSSGVIYDPWKNSFDFSRWEFPG